MISRIEGELVEVDDTRAHVRSGGLVYEVMIPAADRGRMTTAIGEVVTLHTLHLLEGTAQGTSFRPRLLGFATQSDRAFFELFTTVKGIGARKALRIMEIPVGKIARAVHERDVSLLTSLPEVGKRTAEAIIVELKEKVETFLEDGSSTGADRTAAVGAIATAGAGAAALSASVALTAGSALVGAASVALGVGASTIGGKRHHN